MGSEFFWFLDAAVVAVAAALIFRGAKKGAVAVLIKAVSAIVAFIIAFIGCGIASEKIYDAFVRSRIEDYIEERLGDTINYELIAGLSDTDMSRAKLGDTYLSDIEINYDERGTALIDLSSVDLTETGITDADLKAFGIGSSFDYSLIKAGHLEVTEQEVKKYGIGNIVLSYIIASNITSGSVFRAFTDIGDKITETNSPSLSGLGNSLSSGSKDAIYSLVVSIITSAGGKMGDRIMNDIITPTVTVPLKAIVFCIIFTLVILILNIIANVSKLINKIPIVSSVNGIVGAVLGLAEAIVVIELICIIIRFVIALCGDSLVFLNEPAIQRTFIFRFFYATDPLKLLGI